MPAHPHWAHMLAHHHQPLHVEHTLARQRPSNAAHMLAHLNASYVEHMPAHQHALLGHMPAHQHASYAAHMPVRLMVNKVARRDDMPARQANTVEH